MVGQPGPRSIYNQTEEDTSGMFLQQRVRTKCNWADLAVPWPLTLDAWVGQQQPFYLQGADLVATTLDDVH